MFTKIDMVDNSAVLMILIEWRHDDVISDVTPDRYRLELSIFRACEYHNLISLHLMLTKFDIADNQLVFTNSINQMPS